MTQLPIIYRLNPYTDLLLKFEIICGNPKRAYIESDIKPIISPYTLIFKDMKMIVVIVRTEASVNKNLRYVSYCFHLQKL
jgi:hypothetical protein